MNNQVIRWRFLPNKFELYQWMKKIDTCTIYLSNFIGLHLSMNVCVGDADKVYMVGAGRICKYLGFLKKFISDA